MITVALRSIAGRKLRFFLTGLAIVLGVAMVSGTYVLTDTIKAGFDVIFTESYKNTDAVITGKAAFGSDRRAFGFPESLLGEVRKLPGVDAAVGSISDQAQLVGRDGKVISFGGAPNIAFSFDAKADARFNPLTLVDGHWPVGAGEIAIDKSTADKKDYKVGDVIGVAARGPVRRYTITGIAELGGATSIGGATLAIFDVPTAQRIFDKVGKLDQIQVAAKSGVSPQQLVRQIQPILPSSAQVRTGTAQVNTESKDTSQALSFIQYFLLAFGFIALFVGSFVITNTLSITVAQQTREYATMRTIGASRRQILRSVFLEAQILGVLASVAGLFLGLALAKALDSLFVSFGIDLPKAGLVFQSRTIIVSLAVGIGITMLASLRPAFRATRVPPISAVREGATLPPGRFARFGKPAAALTAGAGVALLVFGVTVHRMATGERLALLGVGCVLLFVGVALFAPVLVPPIVAVVGWPATKIGGVAGKLARENSTRNPQRTASTAAALMIGLALVTFVAVLGAGLRASFEDAVDKEFVADYALTSQNGFTPLTVAATDAIRHAPGVTVAAGMRGGQARAFGKTIQLTAVEPGISQVISLKWAAGRPETADRLGADGAFVDKSYAKDNKLEVGSPIRLETPQGAFFTVSVEGIIDPPPGGSPYGRVTISAASFDRHYPNPENVVTGIKMVGGVTPENQTRLEKLLTSFPNAKVQTKAEFKRTQERGIDIILNLLYVLLALSIVISLFGIVNTLVLTVFERTRELGMLRAIGTTRRQVRRMIRHEAVVTSLIGAALGIPIGIALAALVATTVSGLSFAVPWGTLVVFVAAAIVVGIIAAILPARRGSRINVLEALQYE